MSCPFRTLLNSSATPAAKSSERTGDPSRCPFASILNPPDSKSNLQSNPPPETSTSENMGRSPTTGAQQNAGKGKCPLGFGSSSGPDISALHCCLCRSLFFECVRVVGCGHRFCKACVEKFRDCPVCGADVRKLESDSDMQNVVEKYIEVHSKIHTIWEVDSGMPQSNKVDDPAGLERNQGNFFLQLGLRSYMGGNLAAARSRLEVCCSELENQVSECKEDDLEKRIQLECQLGAVSGSLGDCCKRLNDPNSAALHYRQSIKWLKQGKSNPEALREMSVSLNKLGDLRIYQNDVTSARDCYKEALEIREAQLERDPDPSPSQVLDVAVSLTKVADAEQGLDREEESKIAFSRAKFVLQKIKRNGEGLDGGQVALYKSLVQFLGKV